MVSFPLPIHRHTFGPEFDQAVIHSGFAEVDNRDEVEFLMSMLSARRRKVISEYFAGRGMAEIGADLGVGMAAVSRDKLIAVAELRRLCGKR